MTRHKVDNFMIKFFIKKYKKQFYSNDISIWNISIKLQELIIFENLINRNMKIIEMFGLPYSGKSTMINIVKK